MILSNEPKPTTHRLHYIVLLPCNDTVGANYDFLWRRGM